MSQLRRNDSVMCVAALGSLAIGVLGWQIGSDKALAGGLDPPMAVSTGLITHVVPSPDRPTRIIVVDPAQRRIAVYFVSSEGGKIQLKSVRNIVGDLSLQEFNSGDPSPRDIQKLQQRK